jgi:hypothetical protein
VNTRNSTLLIAAALTLTGAAGALAATGDTSATATLSSGKAGAKHVTMTVAFRSELQCGRLMGSRTLALTLPAKAHVAAMIPASAVTVGAKAAGTVVVAGRVVTVTMPAPHGMMCDSITMGVVKVVFAPAAAFANPGTPGAYTVRVAHGSEIFAAPLKIHA